MLIRTSARRLTARHGFGLGQTPIDCSQFTTWITSPTCWGYGPLTWAAMEASAGPAPAAASASVDCSQFWNALTSSQCTWGQYIGSNVFNIPTLLLLAIGVGAMILVIKL